MIVTIRETVVTVSGSTKKIGWDIKCKFLNKSKEDVRTNL